MVRKKIGNLIFVTAMAGLVVFLAYEEQFLSHLEGGKRFQLSDVHFETMGERSYVIPEGMNGYVVFYSDPLDCYSCVRSMNGMKDVAEIYPELGWYAISKGADKRQAFAETMRHFQIPGDYLVDVRGKIANRLGLGKHPLVLVFNSDQKLMAMLPMDVEHSGFIKQMHRYIALM